MFLWKISAHRKYYFLVNYFLHREKTTECFFSQLNGPSSSLWNRENCSSLCRFRFGFRARFVLHCLAFGFFGARRLFHRSSSTTVFLLVWIEWITDVDDHVLRILNDCVSSCLSDIWGRAEDDCGKEQSESNSTWLHIVCCLFHLKETRKLTNWCVGALHCAPEIHNLS